MAQVFILQQNMTKLEFDNLLQIQPFFPPLAMKQSHVYTVQSRFTKWYLDFICVICHHKSSYDAFPNASLAERNERIHRVLQSIWCICLKKCWHHPNQNQRQRHSEATATVKFNLPYI